ncbi:sushi, von Willebrand factor type A, EGF and pentraxin domain-containing protein 1 isoform X2 [Cylas formicarius]|uniref:sushi, von Willebrand factor type A, EGF and pentraxin domain-containing protein 1 isoform X2 n=1 Tax=Cylas formicarius TaxID=197179 RepID=UPI0029589AEF|nr:sushi, von Willebrand factor type A, EGF and pentraxin domain-containing protein 1 isoform X2 [Cylas formicarius]
MRFVWWSIVALALAFLCVVEEARAFSTTIATPSEDDDDWDEDESSEVEDEGKIYKNPRNSPSTLCPRDEEQATLLGQKCLRKCSSDEDCKSKKKKCLCDGACGMSCIKPDRECPEPEQISFGTVTTSGKLFGARASYACQHGYHVVGLQSRTCQADGQWAGQAPACKQNIYCLSPPTIDHARHNALPEQATFDLDSTLQYYCHTGYVTNGFPRAKCLAIDNQASWYGPDISCEPRSCGTPTDISHGWHAGECYTFGCRITYHCAEGYELVGRTERYCQADGTWTPKEVPTCVLVTAVQCPPPENPRHGKAIYTSCSYNSVVRYECKYGYTLVGESTRRCGADRKWSGAQPVCKEINCGHPGRLWNGWLENIEGGTGLGASIIFRCHEGMLLEGNSSTVCQIDGKWRYPLPKCYAPCVVPHVTKGRVILLSRNDTAPTSTVVTHGEMLTVDCDPKFEFQWTHEKVTCNNGTWTQMPKCEPAKCQSLPKAPRHGMVSAPEMKHGMKAKFRCKDGYVLKGNPFVECSFGNWTGMVPKCDEVFCPYPGLVENGKILLVGNMGLYDYRPYVKKVANNKQIMYDCEKGYVLAEGPPGATCVGGRWSPSELPKCLPGEHPRFRFNRRRRSVKDEEKGSGFLDVYRKSDGRYYLRRLRRDVSEDGPSKAICRNGRWLPFDRPRCVFVDHRNRRIFPPRDKRFSELDSILRHHAYLNDSDKPRSRKPRLVDVYILEQLRNALGYHQRTKRGLKGGGGSRAVGGLSHRGSSSQHSVRRGNKGRNQLEDIPDPDNDITPTKKPKAKHRNGTGGACDALQNEPFVNIEFVKHGRDQNVSFGSGTIVKLACGKGYGLNMAENKTAKCVRGKWRPNKPECFILPCFVPETPFGIYKLVEADNTSKIDTMQPLNSTMEVSNGLVVEFSCEPGYSVQGSSNMRCWHGDWAVTAFPECSPAPCQLPKITHGQYTSGYRAGLTIANGSSVTFQCDQDYIPSTVQPIECLLGDLFPKHPACRREDGEEPPETHYLGGKDIVKGGDITVIEYGTSTGKPCGPPAKVRGSLIYRNGEPLVDDENNFPDGSEVTFNCIESIMGEKTTWKIVCEDGSWIGRSLNCDIEDLMAAQMVSSNSTCVFRNQEPNVVSFYNDQKIKEEVVEFPAGAVLVSRCVDIGKYAMVGPNKRRCMGGDWDGPKPACFGLNQENDYSMEKPPTILFRHQLGPIAQSNDGKLIVYPGTILHMECLWIRRFGVPKWTVSHDYRKYPEGWTTDPGRDSQLEYRLSIFHASKDDSGLFTCVTPARYTHSVEIIVKAVHCPAIPQRRGLTASTQSTKMNTRIKFYCVNGNALIGAPEIVCLPSGNWSAPFPVCESIECGEVGAELGPHLKVLVVSREVGGRAVFTCDSGYGLRGPAETVCQHTGDWASPFPTCEEVHCDEPKPPENGYIQGNGPYKAGDVVQFNCNPDYMMEGQPIIACQENSRWSGKLPKCVQACSYPGTTISGRMSSVKFYYKIGENITFTCEEGLALKGAAMLRCLKNGKWSNAIPTCVSPDAIRKREVSEN